MDQQKQEMYDRFKKNVEYIEKTVPPDDIYLFTEQTLMAALYFLRTLQDFTDIKQLCRDDPIFAKWTENIGAFYLAQVNDFEMTLDLKMDEFDE